MLINGFLLDSAFALQIAVVQSNPLLHQHATIGATKTMARPVVRDRAKRLHQKLQYVIEQLRLA